MITVVMPKSIITLKPTVPTATAVAVQDLDRVADPAKNFAVIMKDGTICKNTIQ